MNKLTEEYFSLMGKLIDDTEWLVIHKNKNFTSKIYDESSVRYIDEKLGSAIIPYVKWWGSMMMKAVGKAQVKIAKKYGFNFKKTHYDKMILIGEIVSFTDDLNFKEYKEILDNLDLEIKIAMQYEIEYTGYPEKAPRLEI
ncbi:MAG: hypothetical protein FWD26_09450 [Treponema sp.]|nr:hypothetical protein [Treponema sp.]